MKKLPNPLLAYPPLLAKPLPSSGDSHFTLDEEYCEEITAQELERASTKSVVDRKSSKSRTSTIIRSQFFLEHDASSARLTDVYDVRKEVLGKGGFGAIRRARLKGRHGAWDRVVKTVEHRSTKDRLQFKREVNILRTLDHPNVCRVYESFEDIRCYHLVLEFIDGKDLFGYVFERLSNGRDLEERASAMMTWQMLQGLHYCHSQNIIHRDVKPENIMVQCNPEHTDDGVHIKIIDFGLAAHADVLASMPRGSFCGTYAYVAPEVISGKYPASAASDLWAVGLLVHVFLFGDLPSDEVRHGEQPVNLSGQRISKAAKQIVTGLLSIDVQGRMAAARSQMTNEQSWTNTHREIVRKSSSEASLHGKSQSLSSHSLLTTDTVTSFISFHRSVMLHKAVITAVAMQLLESHHVHKVQEQFIAIDIDGNGRLSKAEFCKAIADQAPRGVADDVNAWVATVFCSIDTDHSGEIEYSEFLAAAVAECSSRNSASVLAAFHVFDVDRNKKISAAEFARVLDMMPQDISQCIAEFDANGDGEIDFEEFSKLVNKRGMVTDSVKAPTIAKPAREGTRTVWKM